MMGAATKIKLRSSPRAALLPLAKLMLLVMIPKRHPSTTHLPLVLRTKATTATAAALTSSVTLIRRPWLPS